MATVILSATDLISLGSNRSDANQRKLIRFHGIKVLPAGGQVNITEKDPARYDIGWWRKFWKVTETKGVIINAASLIMR